MGDIGCRLIRLVYLVNIDYKSDTIEVQITRRIVLHGLPT